MTAILIKTVLIHILTFSPHKSEHFVRSGLEFDLCMNSIRLEQFKPYNKVYNLQLNATLYNARLWICY